MNKTKSEKENTTKLSQLKKNNSAVSFRGRPLNEQNKRNTMCTQCQSQNEYVCIVNIVKSGLSTFPLNRAPFVFNNNERISSDLNVYRKHDT